ncbi:MAG: 1-deoxy-D-xylulose-5-phosphate reductoisomerase [Planctomycetota bacterium]|nr:1-deoxy-D-xylulose-5-phosphate reductoisomerase [Planctomycetota bacterium]
MSNNPKRIVILGSTGSVGRQALEIIAVDEGLSICGLAAGSNWRLLSEQAGNFRPDAVAIAEPAAAGELSKVLPEDTDLLTGPEAMSDLIWQVRPDMVLTAVVGSAGLTPTLTAIECGADLAIANKESLVMAGAIIMPAARRAGINVLPVDSEHSAIFQCLVGHETEDVHRVTLTASGGPFRNQPPEKARRASLAEVLKHPTWRMGRKISIDSATMMNKALEIIETHHLFDLPVHRIEVVIHPESIVHACVEFFDGSVLAQMSRPAMTTPISFALHYPARPDRPSAPLLDLTETGCLHFEAVDMQKYPALELGYEVVRRGGTAGAVLNAANETAVEAFIAGRIQFGQIVEIVKEVLSETPTKTEIDLETVLVADDEARRRTEEIVTGSQ